MCCVYYSASNTVSVAVVGFFYFSCSIGKPKVFISNGVRLVLKWKLTGDANSISDSDDSSQGGMAWHGRACIFDKWQYVTKNIFQ